MKGAAARALAVARTRLPPGATLDWDGARAGESARRAEPAAEDAGSVVLYMSIFCGIAAVVVMGLLAMGERYRARRQLRNAADVMALAAAASLRENGYALGSALRGVSGIEQLGLWTAPYTTQEVTFAVHPGREKHQRIVEASLQSVHESRLGLGEVHSFKHIAYAEVFEREEAGKRPGMILTLDFSGSMGTGLFGKGGQRADLSLLLLKVVMRYMIYTFPVRNGLVIFNDKIIRSVPPEPAGTNVAAIQAALGIARCEPNDPPEKKIAGSDLCVRTPPKAQGGTNVGLAFDEARELYEQLQRTSPDGTARSVALITDGDPTRGWTFWPPRGSAGVAKVAAKKLCHLPPDGVQISAIELQRSGGSESCSKGFLKQVTCHADSDAPAPTLCNAVSDLDDVDAFLRAMSRQVCRYGPLKLLEGDSLSVFFKNADGAEERLVPESQFTLERIDKEHASLVLSYGACSYLGAHDDRRLIIRWGGGRLVDEDRIAR